MLSLHLTSLTLLASLSRVSSLILPINITSTAPHDGILTDPNPFTCYDPSYRSQRVSLQDCIPVTRKIITRRHAELPVNVRGTACPMTFRAENTPCEVMLVASSEAANDKFSLRVVGLKAVQILEDCGKGPGKSSWGGEDIIGPKELFRVIVVNPNSVSVALGAKGNETGAIEEL